MLKCGRTRHGAREDRAPDLRDRSDRGLGRLLWRVRKTVRPDLKGWDRFKVLQAGAVVILLAAGIIFIAAYGLLERPCPP